MSEFLAEASVLIRPDTTGFRAALIAELEIATRGIIVPVAIAPAVGGKAAAAEVGTVTAAQTELAAATHAATTAKVEQIDAQTLGAAAARKDAEAQVVDAESTAKNALAHEQLARGAGASTLSLLKVRGATLAASSPFLAGAAAVTLLAKATAEAVSEQAAMARVSFLFGPAAKQVEDDAKGMAASFGLSTVEALHFEGSVANVLLQAGFAHQRIPQMSEDLVKLAADMAAFNNVPTSDVLNTLQLSILGNTRGLKSLGVELGAADVNNRALALSGKETTKELTQQDRIVARLSLLFERTKNQQGAFARQQGDAAEQAKILRANLSNLGAAIGNLLLPPLTLLAEDLNLVVAAGEKLSQLPGKIPFLDDVSGFLDKHKDLKQGLLGALAFPTLGVPLLATAGIKDLIKHFEDQKKAAPEAAAATTSAADEIVKDINRIQDALRGAVTLANRISLANAQKQFDALAETLTQVQIKAGGSSGNLSGQADVLKQQEAAARQAVQFANNLVKLREGTPGEGTAVTNRRKAESQLLKVLDQEKSIQDQINSQAVDIANQIADAVTAAQKKVQDILDAAQQKFLDSLANRQALGDIQQARAERTKSLVDDIQAQKAERKLIIQLEAEAKTQISDAQTLKQTLLSLALQLVQVNNAIAADQAAQAANRQARNQARFDRAAESIDLDIQLAQTNKDIRGEIAARQRRIQLDLEREKSVRGDIIATKKLRNDIAEQRAAIKDLKGQVDQRAKDFKALEFSFLQTQSGFAANLLSNILPSTVLTGTVAGRTGGGAINTPTNPARTPAALFSNEAATRTGPGGATQGQMSALLTIQRQTLTVLQRISGQRTHPEAVAEKAGQSVSMDFF